MIFAYIAFIVAAYLLGSTPFMIMMGRAKGFDLSHEPDLHFALWHKVGHIWGFFGLLLDILKGVIPVLISFLLNFPIAVIVISGLAALCGQMWTVFRHFDGERGNSTGVGVGMTLSFAYNAPLIFIIIFIIVMSGALIRLIRKWKASGDNLNEHFKLGGSPSHTFPLFVLFGFSSMPITSALLNLPIEITLCYVSIIVLILIRRLTAGLIADLKTAKNPVMVIINRLLYDRSDA